MTGIKELAVRIMAALDMNFDDEDHDDWVQSIIERELENGIPDIVTADLRKRIPSVLEKVKNLWKEELGDNDLFSSEPEQKDVSIFLQEHS